MREMEITDRLYLASEYVGNTQVSDHHRAHVQQLQRTPPHSVGYDQVDTILIGADFHRATVATAPGEKLLVGRHPEVSERRGRSPPQC